MLADNKFLLLFSTSICVDKFILYLALALLTIDSSESILSDVMLVLAL